MFETAPSVPIAAFLSGVLAGGFVGFMWGESAGRVLARREMERGRLPSERRE